MVSTNSSTFLNRARGLKKKTYELSTLCGIDALMISYQGENLEKPQIWPEGPCEITRIINRYKGLNEGDNRGGKLRKVDFSDFLTDVQSAIDDQMDGFSSEQLTEISAVLDSKLSVVRSMLKDLDERKRKKRLHLKETELRTEFTSEAQQQNCSVDPLEPFDQIHPILDHHHQVLPTPTSLPIENCSDLSHSTNYLAGMPDENPMKMTAMTDSCSAGIPARDPIEMLLLQDLQLYLELAF
uniref:MADS-box domain-containing protein n=1 Tax=Nelumbo nucifera TaxID=4432 RepID=A0A822Z5B2_NELNU|nr:TPA_asm: hypothetical protein HUJ06_014076 [Nelumbo nucifera]